MERPHSIHDEWVTKKPLRGAALAVKKVAERTGLEPATSGVTGRRSNQLSYRSTFLTFFPALRRGGFLRGDRDFGNRKRDKNRLFFTDDSEGLSR